MRVLHAISSGGMYGAETVILTLCRAMNAALPGSAGLAVFLNTDKPETSLHEAALASGIPSTLVRCVGRVDRSTAGALRGLMTGFDVLHTHGYKADLYGYVALRQSAKPLVATCHNWTDTDRNARMYGALDRLILRRFDAIAAVSADVRARLQASGVTPGRIRLVSNGIETGPYRAVATVRHAAHTGPLRVGFAGRLSQEKGIDVFLQVARVVLQQAPEVEFVVAGDGPERAAAEAAIARDGTATRVRLLGRCERMAEVYASLDVLLSTSRTEGSPMGLMEAMAATVPVVATAVGDVPMLLDGGRCGLLAPSMDVQGLAAAVLRLRREPALRVELGCKGQQWVEQSFSAQTMLRNYLTLYRQVLERAA